MVEMLRVFVQTKIIGALPQDVRRKQGLDQDWTKLFTLVDSTNLSSTTGNLPSAEKLQTHLVSAVRHLVSYLNQN